MTTDPRDHAGCAFVYANRLGPSPQQWLFAAKFSPAGEYPFDYGDTVPRRIAEQLVKDGRAVVRDSPRIDDIPFLSSPVAQWKAHPIN